MDIDKYSTKTLLFTRAKEALTHPFPTNGYNTHRCFDCGDTFVLESSLKYHVNRKTVLINYSCKTCNKALTFMNRCKLLEHIRSHVFKTTTINLSDLNVGLLPIEEFPYIQNYLSEPEAQSNTQLSTINANNKTFNCHECNGTIDFDGLAHVSRSKHYMRKDKDKIYTCPVCSFALPSVCAVQAHLRLHLKVQPFICPECGINVGKKCVQYPFDHECNGFKTMNATSYIQCPKENCQLLHPNDFFQHLKQKHLKSVYKCPFCVCASYSHEGIVKHIQRHNSKRYGKLFFQCDICLERFNPTGMQSHLKTHVFNHFVYPCWACGKTFTNVCNLINHTKNDCTKSNFEHQNLIKEITGKPNSATMYRVIKKCDKCKRSFTYRCAYDVISKLPKECPSNCSVELSSKINLQNIEHPSGNIKCPLCADTISEEWSDIKTHFSIAHESYKCLDASIVLNRCKVKKTVFKKKRLNSKALAEKAKKLLATEIENAVNEEGHSQMLLNFKCCRCDDKFSTKELLEEHIISHRDLCAAYQCLECGLSFVVKRSFATHLLMKHNIEDLENYIQTKNCFNELALNKELNENIRVLNEFHCKICFEQYDSTENLEKHFRTHGMAFLRQIKKEHD